VSDYNISEIDFGAIALGTLILFGVKECIDIIWWLYTHIDINFTFKIVEHLADA